MSVTHTSLGYVIERFIGSELHYWTGKDIEGGLKAFPWTTNHMGAIRFSDRGSAEIVLRCLLGNIGSVHDHIWITETED